MQDTWAEHGRIYNFCKICANKKILDDLKEALGKKPTKNVGCTTEDLNVCSIFMNDRLYGKGFCP